MDNILTLNIVLILLGVTNTILIVILLSYQKNTFEYFLDSNSLQNKLLKSIEQTLTQIGKGVDKLADLKNTQDILAKIREEQGALLVSKEKIESLSNRLDEIIEGIRQLNKNEGKECEKQRVNIIAYNDAVMAFDNINRKFYEIRKYPQIVLELSDMLMSGGGDVKVNFNEMPDDHKQFSANLQSDIMMFNRNYRQHLISYLHSVGMEWGECVRNPYNKPFDNEWDENMLGDEVENGTIVSRVVQLGYEFPNSVKIGRTKSKTL